MNARPDRGRQAFVVAAVLQVIVVSAVPRHGSGSAGLVVAGVLAGLFAARRRLPPRLGSMLLATACFGGGGMFVGTLIDLSLSVPVPPCHGATGTADLGTFTNWMNGLMLAGCAPGCWVVCARRDRLWKELLQHVLAGVAMWLGMFAGGRLLAPSLVAFGAVGGMHLAMLAGMLVGVGAFESVRHLHRRQSPPCASLSPQLPLTPGFYESGSAESP